MEPFLLNRKQSSVLLFVFFVFTACARVQAQDGSVVPHRIIQGLKYDWPTAVVCLENADSEDLIGLLRPRMSTYARLSAVPEGNLLIATMPTQRMALLLDVIAGIDIDRVAPVEAAKHLPNVFAESRTQPEPDEVATTSLEKQNRYVPRAMRLGRISVYLQQYTLVPIRPSFQGGSIVISGDSDKVNQLMQLAEAIDVENYQQCVNTNGI